MPSLFLLLPASYSSILRVNMLYFGTVSTIMHDVSTCSTPKNTRERFIHLSDVHAYNTRFSCADNLFVQKSKLNMKLMSFNAFGSNVACRAELGRFPLIIAINQKIMNYSTYLLSKDNCSILKQIFLMSQDRVIMLVKIDIIQI